MDDYNYIVDDMAHRIHRLYDAITDWYLLFIQHLRASQPLPPAPSKKKRCAP